MTPAVPAEFVEGSPRFPLTSSFSVGEVFPMPTLPASVMIIRWALLVIKRSDGLGEVADESGRALKKPAPRPNVAPPYPKFSDGPAFISVPNPAKMSAVGGAKI